MSYKIPLEKEMLESRMIELVKNHLEISISTDVSDFDNVDCHIYSESTADGYDVHVCTNTPNKPSICEDVYYYEHDLTNAFRDQVRWGDKTFYIEEWLYNDCYFEDYIANSMFDDLVNGNDFNSFLQTEIITEKELEYLKEEYGIEDEETTEA